MAATLAPVTTPVRTRVSLLGGLRIEYGGRTVSLPLGSQRLIAFVALRQSAKRSELSGVLWPEVPEHRADGSLRTTLWRLNRDCPHVVNMGTELSLAGEPEIDVQSVLALAHRVATTPTSLPVELLLDTPGGELLPGWYEDWVLADRERLRQVWMHLLEGASAELLTRGLYTPALYKALQALSIEPLRESAHRLVIKVHLAEGNVVEALRQYDACRALLQAELGIEPSEQLRKLIGIPPDNSVAASAARPRAHGRAVGRDGGVTAE
jgi:DNA-binding SARP family transcriptional activator